MPLYQFKCETCGFTYQVRGAMSAPPQPDHCGHPMRPVFTAPYIIIQRGAGDWVERAARGEAEVPGMSTREVRQTVEGWRRKGKRKAR